MQQALTQETSRQPGSETEQVVRKWLVIFGSLFQREITPLLIGAWCELLGDLAPGMMERACSQTAKTIRFFPSAGDIRAQLDQAEAKGFELEAETEWQKLLAWVRENVFPDTGIRRGAPKLAPAVNHAAKAAGGIYFIERCSEEQLVWCRKTFLAAFENIHETREAEHLLGDGDAKRIIGKLVVGAENRNQLASPPEEAEGPLPPLAEVRAVLERVADIPSEEEWERRKLDLKRQANEWAVAHGLAVEPSEQPVEVCT